MRLWIKDRNWLTATQILKKSFLKNTGEKDWQEERGPRFLSVPDHEGERVECWEIHFVSWESDEERTVWGVRLA